MAQHHKHSKMVSCPSASPPRARVGCRAISSSGGACSGWAEHSGSSPELGELSREPLVCYVQPPRHLHTRDTSPVPINTGNGESAAIFYVSFPEENKKKKKGGNHSNFIYSLCNTRELFLGHLSSQLRSCNNSVATKAIPNMEKQYKENSVFLAHLVSSC